MLRGRVLDKFFDIGIAIKGIDGLLEAAGGIMLFMIGKAELSEIVIDLTQHELSKGPNDMIANWASAALSRLSTDTKLFAASYLLGHGVVKIFVAVELLQRKLWAYPVAIVILCSFAVYQAYRLVIRYSPGLLLLTAFDVFVIILIFLEYRRLKANRL